MKVGLIGCGGIAASHIETYEKLKDVKVVSLCDLNLDLANYFAKKFRVGKTYSDYPTMFEQENLDLVDICTPLSTHKKIVCDAAKRVPAILLEKPMAMSVAECDEIVQAVNKYKTKLCIGHTQLFSPLIQKARSLVCSNEFDLLSFRTTLKASFENLRKFNIAPAWNVLPEQKGIIWEVCCHHAYLQLHFLPDITEIYAVGKKVNYPVYDDFAVFLRTSDDHFGIIEISWICRETEVIYELQSTDGRRLQINWEFDYLHELSEDPPFTYGGVARNMLVDDKRLLQKWIRFITAYVKKKKRLPMFNMISSYVDSIKMNLPPPVTPQDGRKTIQLLECIEKSLNTHEPVSMGVK